MNRLVINADLGQHKISKHIYGHFAEHLGRCIYEGVWVGEDSPIPNTRGIRNDVVDALRRLRIPNLRWPVGCFADTYHWPDGIGPRAQRPAMVNVHWGGVTENNHFGTHEFMDLCGLLECEPYICGNVGSGTVQEMAQWLEYLTMAGQSPMADRRRANGRDAPWKVRYWGVGNENWGCGGNMRPEFYADQYRRYACFCRNFSGGPLFRIACGANGMDYRWTEVLMREAAAHMNGLSLHYYCGSGRKSRSATRFEEDDWFHLIRSAMRMDEIVARHSSIMDQYDPVGRVGMMVDEWGTWHEVEPGTNPGFLYQQNSLRDALVAGLTLDVFNRHCRRVKMANIAQTINVLQAMCLTDGAKMIVTPTYHVFEMYAVHQDAVLLPSTLECEDYGCAGEKIPAVSASASRDAQGRVHISLCHFDPAASRSVAIDLRGMSAAAVSGRILTAPAITAHNTFDRPDAVRPSAFDGARRSAEGILVELPPRCVVVLEIG